MRILVMLRHLDQHEGGVKVYTQNVLPHLFTLGREHHFIAVYRNRDHLGTYAHFPNVEEIAIPTRSLLSWDQIVIPRVAAKKKVDLIFNPKFTAPLRGAARRVFVLHGSEWFKLPRHHTLIDRVYVRTMFPLYCRAADRVITVAETVKRHAVAHTRIAAEKFVPIHNGYDPQRFRLVNDAAMLRSVKAKYDLPDQFLLWVGQFDTRKNLGGLLKAFARLADEVPHDLVLVGPKTWNVGPELDLIEELHLQERVHLTGFIAHDDLPAVYNLASAFVFPSLCEGFGIPLLEAMACGTPIVTASTGSPPEVVSDAALTTDPHDVEQLASAIRSVLGDLHTRQRLIAAGLERAKHFSWERCASALLSTFAAVAGVTQIPL